jgi:hypothetical protein
METTMATSEQWYANHRATTLWTESEGDLILTGAQGEPEGDQWLLKLQAGSVLRQVSPQEKDRFYVAYYGSRIADRVLGWAPAMDLGPIPTPEWVPPAEPEWVSAPVPPRKWLGCA